jgi:hypothetical protein
MKGSSELDSWVTVLCLGDKKDYGLFKSRAWIREPEGKSLWKCSHPVIYTQPHMHEHTCMHTDACIFTIVGLLTQIHSYTHT